MSARASLRAVRKGKENGVRVTCEVAPHHFTLTDEALGSPIPYDTNTKMNPPLREAADREAMLAGIADGTVDAIATDHAPHHYDEKNVEFDRAPFGIVGLETAVSLVARPPGARRADPAAAAGRADVHQSGAHPARAPADRCRRARLRTSRSLRPICACACRPSKLRSRSKNTPFDGWELRGGVAATVVGGRTLFVNPDAPVGI